VSEKYIDSIMHGATIKVICLIVSFISVEDPSKYISRFYAIRLSVQISERVNRNVHP